MRPATIRTLTVVLTSMLALASTAGVAVGLYAVSEDMSDRSDDWDGFAAAIGGILAAVSGLGLILCLGALLTVASRPRTGYAFALAAGVWWAGITMLVAPVASVLYLVALAMILLAVVAGIGLSQSKAQGGVEIQSG